MEKFSGKEKVALVIFGLILLAIIIQIAVRVNVFEPGPAGVIPIEMAEVDLGGNLLNRPGVVLATSSRNQSNQTPDRLIDGNRKSFWHVSLDLVEDPAWVTVDFGKGNEKTVRALAALPREDLPRQFLRTAQFLGSEDGEDWEPVAAVVLWETPRWASWWKWEFANNRAFRYYKLLITDGHEGGKFYSMAGLAFFE